MESTVDRSTTMVVPPAIVGLVLASSLAVAAYKWFEGEESSGRRVVQSSSSKMDISPHYVVKPVRRNHTLSAVDRLRALPRLANEYYAIRHGESEANVAALVSSDRVLSRTQHGLTEIGRTDAENGALAIIDMSPEEKETIVVHSPFLRTVQTAAIVAKLLNAEAVVSEDLLCERYFGVFEGQHSHSSYGQVWAQDEINGCEKNAFSCESVYSVSERAAEVILKCEKMAPDGGCRVILVSHGDTIQILRATLDRAADQKWHRKGEHLNPGQAIRLQLVFNEHGGGRSW